MKDLSTQSRPSEDLAISAAERAIEGGIALARAEAKLALLRTREFAVGAVAALALTLIAGFLAQIAVALLVLGPLVQAQLDPATVVVLLAVPAVLAVVAAILAFRAVRNLARQTSHARTSMPSYAPQHSTLAKT